MAQMTVDQHLQVIFMSFLNFYTTLKKFFRQFFKQRSFSTWFSARVLVNFPATEMGVLWALWMGA